MTAPNRRPSVPGAVGENRRRIQILEAVASSGGGGGYDTVEDEGTPLTQRSTIDFQGAGVTAADTGGVTVVTIPGGSGGGGELDYVEVTSFVTITATTAAGANTIVAGNSVSYSGSQRIKVEFYAPTAFIADTNKDLYSSLWDGATNLGNMSDTYGGSSSVSAPVFAVRFLTPSAGSHTFTVKGYKTGGSGTSQFQGGSGGSGGNLPIFMRITEA